MLIHLSYCTLVFPYGTNRFDASLMDFEPTYTSNKIENPECYFLYLKTHRVCLNGEVACNVTCRIPMPVALPNISIVYIKRAAGDIILELDTNGNKTAEFRKWTYY